MSEVNGDDWFFVGFYTALVGLGILFSGILLSLWSGETRRFLFCVAVPVVVGGEAGMIAWLVQDYLEFKKGGGKGFDD